MREVLKIEVMDRIGEIHCMFVAEPKSTEEELKRMIESKGLTVIAMTHGLSEDGALAMSETWRIHQLPL